MNRNELLELAMHAAKRTAPANYTVQTVDTALLDALKSMTGSVNNFMRNKYDIYDIITETADVIVPRNISEVMNQFVEIRTCGEGEKIRFKRGPIGRGRAKKFLTQVGLSGVYETFRLDNETFEVATKAIGGAFTMDFQRFLDGAESLAELMDVLTEAQVDAIFGEVQKALINAQSSMPTNNKVVGSYSADNLLKIVNTVKAYGGGATIFASPEFIAAMGPDAIVPIIPGAAQALYPAADIEDIHRFGRVMTFRGTPVVELRQSFVDEKNEQVWIHPQYAYVLPTGKEKVVKMVLEGATQIWDATNRDQSIEVNIYRKIGVAVLAYNNWGIYQNTGISAANWYDASR